MTCQQAARYLMPYLDSDLDVKTECDILEHLEKCDACRERFAREQHFERLLENAVWPTGADRGLWERVLAPVRAQAAGRVPTRRRALVLAGAGVGVVCALLVFVPAPPNPEAVLLERLAVIHDHIGSGEESFLPVASLPGDMASYFKKQIGLESVRLPAGGATTVAARGARVCWFRDVPLGVVVASDDGAGVTYFWINTGHLGAWTELREHLTKHPDPRGGSTGRHHFARATLPDAVVFAISELPGEHLARLLASL